MSKWHFNSIVLLSGTASLIGYAQPIAAQVIPDDTLPAGERSQVSGDPNFQIDGGARRGGNLFHSFSQFSVPTGGSAFFNNAAGVQNIFSRVTGGSASNIDGVIRANGTANVFLLNPNGILFGPNASLNIGGSFLATTADAIGFPNGEVFSGDAAQPVPSQLLTVNPNALFFNQLTPQSIVNRSTLNDMGLQVLPRQNLMLVGGSVQLENGRLMSPGSYVELGGVGGVGSVNLATTGEDWELTIPNGVTRADVSLSNGSAIDVTGDSGSIRMLAQNIDISESVLQIGIPRDSRLPNTQTGDLDLNATGSIALSMSSLNSDLLGQGTLGDINLTADDQIFLDHAGIYSTVRPTGVGNASDINIATKSLALTSSIIQSHTSGRGSAGNVNLNARDTVSFSDFSNVYTMVRGGGIGNAGDINVTTGSFSLTNSWLVSFEYGGLGNAGSININARDTFSLRQNSGLNSYTIESGNAGGINVNAYNTVSLDNSSIVNFVILGTGNVGGINITTGSLSLTNGAELLSTTLGQGNGGSVNISARDRVTVDGAFAPEETYSYYRASRIRTGTVLGAEGQGGDVTISTGSLFLTNGGGVETSTRGRGNAGRVIIHARDVQIRGTSLPLPTDRGQVLRLAPLTDYRSGVYTSATSGSVGNAGNVSINTGTLSVADQGRINTNAQGQGRAGNIQIQASDAVSFDRGDAISTLESGALGNGGNIDITARSLSVLNNAQLSASTLGEGNAGNITARADTVNVNSGGQLLTTTFSSGNAGNITVNTPNLQLSGATSGLFTGTTSAGDAGNLTIQPRGNGQSVRVSLQDGARISASTSNSGRGGELTIAAPESITLTGNGVAIAAGTGGSGVGGNLNLRTGTLNIQNQAEVTVSSSGTGSAGSLFVEADRILLDNQGSIRADTTGGGGNINLRSPLILLRNGSSITTNATGANIPGGNIAIDTQFLVAVPNEDSNISANSEDFRGGNVSIDAVALYGIQPSLTLTPLSDVTATGATSALNGAIDVTTAGIDPANGLVALPTTLVDSSGLIGQGCPASQGNSFVVSGRGGLPPNPEQQLDDDADWQDRRRLSVPQQTLPDNSGDRTPLSAADPPIVEATSWQIASTGEIRLVTTADPTAQNMANRSIACQGR